jgi:hypothetical protein
VSDTVPNLSELIESFEKWRTTRSSRNDLPPDALCEDIRRAATQYGKTRIRGVLGYTTERMRRCLDKSTPSAKPLKTRKRKGRRLDDLRVVPTFSELVIPPMPVHSFDDRPPICVVDAPNGARMTVYTAESLVCDLVGTFVANLPSTNGTLPC